MERDKAHMKASGKPSFPFLSVRRFLEIESCARARAAIRGFIALSKWKDSSKTREMRTEQTGEGEALYKS